MAYLNYKGLVSVDWEKIATVSNKAISDFSGRVRKLCLYRDG